MKKIANLCFFFKMYFDYLKSLAPLANRKGCNEEGGAKITLLSEKEEKMLCVL